MLFISPAHLPFPSLIFSFSFKFIFLVSLILVIALTMAAAALQRFVNFVASFPSTVQTGLHEFVSAVSPGRKRRHSLVSDAPINTPSDIPPFASDPFPPRLSTLPPLPAEPAPKRRRTSFPIEPAAAAAAAAHRGSIPQPSSAPRFTPVWHASSAPVPVSQSSPFARATPLRFGRLPHPDPSSAARPAVGLRSVLRSPRSVVCSPHLYPTSAHTRPATPVPAPPPLAPLDVHAVFRYATPRPRPTPNRAAQRRPLLRQSGDAAPFFVTAQARSTERAQQPKRQTPQAQGQPHQSTFRPPLPRTQQKRQETPEPLRDGHWISLPASDRHSDAVVTARKPTEGSGVRGRSLAVQTPSYRKSLEKRTSTRKKQTLAGLLERQAKKMYTREQAVQVLGEHNWRTQPRVLDGSTEKMRELHKETKAREAGTIIKTHSGLDRRELRENFPQELVELMEDNPKMAEKIFKLHGARIANVVEAEVRKRERNNAIRKEEEHRTRLQARADVEKGGSSLRKTLKRVLGESFDEPEQPPKGAAHFDEIYWSDDDEDWDEDMDDQAVQERENQVTVTEEKSAFAPLTDSALKRLRQYMIGGAYSPAELANVNGCIITGKDLARLKPHLWLNDEIVNAYMELLGKRNEEQRNEGDKENSSVGGNADETPKVKIMNSFFYAKLVQFNRAKGCSVYDYTRVRRWTRRFDVFSYDMMLIPINQSNTHWTLGVVNFKEKWVQHLDSMGTGGSMKVREHLLAWVRDEATDKKKAFVQDEWTMPTRDVPKQENSDDCGVFLCKFADFLSRGWTQFTFSQQHMNYFRSRIAHELLMGRAT